MITIDSLKGILRWIVKYWKGVKKDRHLRFTGRQFPSRISPSCQGSMGHSIHNKCNRQEEFVTFHRQICIPHRSIASFLQLDLYIGYIFYGDLFVSWTMEANFLRTKRRTRNNICLWTFRLLFFPHSFSYDLEIDAFTSAFRGKVLSEW